MNRPNIVVPGPWQKGFDLCLDYIDANRPVSGIGAQVVDVAGGRAIIVQPSTGGGGRGMQLHNIPGLAGHIPDPVSIAAQVLEDVTGSITLPDSSTLISSISSAFSSVLTGGSVPSQATVQGWVDAYLGSTLDTLVGDIEAATTAVLNALTLGVPDTLSNYFNSENAPSAGNGDKIYTASAGICYEIWQQNGGIPVSNSIFAVPFTIGEGEGAKTWVALTTFPAPNISQLVTAVTGFAMNGLNALMSLLSHALVAAIMSLFEFATLIQPLIEDLIESALVFVWAAIDSLDTELAALTVRVEAIEVTLDAAPSLDVIDTAGFARTIKVLEANTGSNFKNTHKFIDPETGGTFELQFPTWFATDPGGNTDFKKFYWLGQDGVHWGADVLMNTAEGYPRVEDTPTASGTLYNRESVETCEEGLIDILKAEHEEE